MTIVQTNWYVITGAPSSGKTTLINQLAQQGYPVIPEIAREYIESFLSREYSLAEVQQNNRQVQRGILARALKRERQLQPSQLFFFDRGTADSLGYFNYYQLDTQPKVHPCHRLRYKAIFYCQQLPLERDAVRIEDNITAKKIGEYIYQAYVSLGYQLIELPAVSVEERIDMIGLHIQQSSAVYGFL